MSFSVGIVGLPNVGKSTLFQAITKKEVDISNYPFCTISPNVGIAKVPDKRLEKLAEFSKSEKIVPTVIEFIDIAGLVKNAHKGEGLGNKFLANIREVDMIAHIARGFENENISHISKKVDPANDIDVVNLEFILADLETVNKILEKTKKEARSGDEKKIFLKKTLEKYKSFLENGNLAKNLKLSSEEKTAINAFQLLTNKPMLYVVNVEEKQNIDIKKFLPEIENKIFLPIKLEMELSGLERREAEEFRKELNFNKNISTLDDLVSKCYDLLGLITFLTTGEKETRAWTIKKGSSVKQAGSAIHTDFEEKFIKASVINWLDLIKAGTLQNAISKGLVRTEGKDYTVQDGDVIEFKI